MRLVRIASALVAALLVAAVTAAGASSTKTVTCTLQLQTLAPPGSSGGEDFGTVACDRVFGKGVQHNSKVTITPASPTTGTATGPFKQFFDTGTVHGTFKLAYSITPPSAVTYTGTATFSGGTGVYKHPRGSAKVTCESTDGGTHATCTVKTILTHI
jgi:hypothetical protein